MVYYRSFRYLNNIFFINKIKISAWIIRIMIIMMFLLNIPAYFMNILYDYKTNLLFLLLVEMLKVFIIIWINIGFLKKKISSLTFLI